MCAEPCTMEIPTVYLMQKPVPPTFSKPDGQTHGGLDRIIQKYYTYMQERYLRQFQSFCEKKEMSEDELKDKLFDDDAVCEYLAFDETFPFTTGRSINRIDAKKS